MTYLIRLDVAVVVVGIAIVWHIWLTCTEHALTPFWCMPHPVRIGAFRHDIHRRACGH